MLKQFQDNENDLLETFFNATFHKFQKSPFLKSDVFQTLEMIVTPQCNQHCEYCYITKYGDSLYPQHIRADHDTTLSNMKKLMDYLTYEKHYYFIEYELFAGDLYTTNMVDEETLALEDVLSPRAKDGILCKNGDGTMQWQVVKKYTMPDGQPAVKVMRIA